ncbi:uncharacterized protein DFL_002693 [Arthrobotrys flagrans]|uniref:Uncharacterized protein n=1 Tax=Arthrobotrys flagrans TaxID=97331 RepID=A0A437ABJ5_ARTFL|nr:hypothetical protein DFL_002693 [Arthrobotrys flagrans]
MDSPTNRGEEGNDLPYSTLSIAFASLIFLNKPPELSVREFIYFLRGCLQSDPDSRTDPPQHISNDAYWRNVCKDKDQKILELDQKLIDVNLENQRLLEQLGKQNFNDNEVVKRKGKAKPSTTNVEPLSAEAHLVKWEPIENTYEKLSPGHETIFFILRSLHYSKDTKTVTVNVIKLCKAISTKIHTLCTDDKANANSDGQTRTQQARRTRQSDAAKIKQRLLDAAWVADVTKAFDDIFRRLFMSIARLSTMLEKEEPQIINAARNGVTEAVSDLFCSVLDSVHAASRRFNIEFVPTTKDVRTGCVKILQSFISTLNGEDELQGCILEAIIYVVVEASGKCLCIPKTLDSTTQDTLAKEGRSLRETSVYVLRLLKVTLPLYRNQLANSKINRASASPRNASPIMEAAKRKFHEYVMKGLFGEHKNPNWDELKSYTKENLTDTGRWGGVGIHDDFAFVDENGLANQVWELLELEDFGLVW